MQSVVGYRGFQIIRESQDKPHRIWKDGKIASPGKFWDFGDARREVDHLKYNPLAWDECQADMDG